MYVASLHQVSNGNSKDGNMKGLSICFHMVNDEDHDERMTSLFTHIFVVKGFYAKWADESIKGPASGWNVTPLDVSVFTIMDGVDH